MRGDRLQVEREQCEQPCTGAAMIPEFVRSFLVFPILRCDGSYLGAVGLCAVQPVNELLCLFDGVHSCSPFTRAERRPNDSLHLRRYSIAEAVYLKRSATITANVGRVRGVGPSTCWAPGLGRKRGPAAFARDGITKLSCGEKVEHALYQEG